MNCRNDQTALNYWKFWKVLENFEKYWTYYNLKILKQSSCQNWRKTKLIINDKIIGTIAVFKFFIIIIIFLSTKILNSEKFRNVSWKWPNCLKLLKILKSFEILGKKNYNFYS